MAYESLETIESPDLIATGPPRQARPQERVDDAQAPAFVFVTHRLTREYPDTIAPPRAGELHLWRFRSEWLPVTVQESDSWLSKTERERARLHPSAAQRKRFIAARAVLRWIVGHLFDCAPRAVELHEHGDERMHARHPRDGGDLTIDIAYGGIWIVIGLASTTLGLGVAVPSPSMQISDAGHARKRARHDSLANALRHVHRASREIDPDLLNDDGAARLIDLNEQGRWHLIDIPMPGKICASVALLQPPMFMPPLVQPLEAPLMQVQAFGWPKLPV